MKKLMSRKAPKTRMHELKRKIENLLRAWERTDYFGSFGEPLEKELTELQEVYEAVKDKL